MAASRLITQKQYAARRKVTPSYISKLVRQQKITLVKGLIDAKKADKQMEAFARPGAGSKLRASAAGKRSADRRVAAQPHTPRHESDTAKLTAMRAEREKYMAAQAKLSWEKETGLLLPRAEILEADRRKNVNIRSRFRQLPRTLAARLAKCNAPTECEAMLAESIDLLLAELAAGPPDDPAVLRTSAIEVPPDALAPGRPEATA